ncbi:aminotransferase-like domain-containing protein [Amycolatopsis aidingensis]|uniref:aminotransferase-like domain-containing protein n=1 Tax=Amycolatopsis aidingensis TaxID=2842453 RepID=UPI001C0A9E74|nr:PLP-dependent aminotransferase family protein [Amycolatopsis aidingensis]
MEDYRAVADRIAAEIAAGRLRPGDRLPTQRRFARRHGIANSTAARVYRELARRGLVVGEVGRGTFVRSADPAPEPALAEPGVARVELEMTTSVLPEQSALLGGGLGRMLRPDVLDAALRPVGAAGAAAAREAAAAALARPGWDPEPAQVLFAGNGRQAIAAALTALVPPGERLAVESLTYPVTRTLATRLGCTLVPVDTDEHGLVPEALARAYRAGPLRAVYLQPTLHNPLGCTMPLARRAALAEVLREHGIHAVEDRVYAFLGDSQPPLAALAPEHTVVVDSLSKRLAPGLTLGFLLPPPGLAEQCAAALRSGALSASGFALEAATGWLVDGTVATMERAKRADAAARQELVAERLAGFAVRAGENSYHCWWELPGRWRAETFVAAAARRGIAVTPAAAFSTGTGHAPNAVRLAISAPPMSTLASTLTVLANVARANPVDGCPE